MQYIPENKNRADEGDLRICGYMKVNKNKLPLITVVTVVFNAANTIEDAIVSVTTQSYSNCEYIVIDGGSTDGTLDVIRRYGHAIDYYVSEPDEGIYHAMNKALKLASGEWLVFLGADDVMTDCLMRVAGQLKCPDSIYYGNVKLLSSENLYDGPFNRYKLMQQNICHQSIFYPSSVYKFKNYDEKCGFLADYKYNMELWGGGTPFVFISETVAIFNDNGISSLANEDFQEIKMSLILSELGIFFWITKKMRNFLVCLVKGRLK